MEDKWRKTPCMAQERVCDSQQIYCRMPQKSWYFSLVLLALTAMAPNAASFTELPQKAIRKHFDNFWTEFSPSCQRAVLQKGRATRLFELPNDGVHATNDRVIEHRRVLINGDNDRNHTLSVGESDSKTPRKLNGLLDGVPSTYTCRIVTSSDGKIPTNRSVLPKALYGPPYLLSKLDSIYHAIAHDTTRDLKFMQDEKTNGRQSSGMEEEETKALGVLRTSLEDAGFELLSQRDLDLCEALNAEYLLRLSIQEDLSELDPNISREFYPEWFDKNGNIKSDRNILYGGRVLVFWRGYGQELTRGRLLLPKIDYLQASIVQRVASWLRRRLNVVEEIFARQSKYIARKVEASKIVIAKNAIEMIPSERVTNWTRAVFVRILEKKSKEAWQDRKQEKVFKLRRYGGYRTGVSPNPNGALKSFMLCEVDYPGSDDASESIRLGPSSSYARDRNTTIEEAEYVINPEEVDHDIYEFLNQGRLTCQYDEETENNSSGSCQPMQLLERVTISNLVDFSPSGRKNVLKTIFAKSELLEPTYNELIVLWRPLPPKPEMTPVIQPPKFIYDFADMFDIEGLPDLPKPKQERVVRPPIEIRAFAGVPMANINAALPKTRLIFRPADAFVFDLASIVSFLLVIGSQRFDNPRLDLLALVSVSLWIIRTFFRYSNKLARYDLLVKTFLTSKITHRNSGALKYVATEAGSYRATRAALVYTWLTSSTRQNSSGSSNERSQLVRDGLFGVNGLIGEDKQVRVDIDAALQDLDGLGLVRFSEDGQKLDFVVADAASIVAILSDFWASIFGGRRSLIGSVRNEKDWRK